MKTMFVFAPVFRPWAALAVLGLALNSGAAPAVESPTWRQFVQAKSNGAEPILPDFSFAGYHAGADPIPDVKGPVFNVTRFGAKGDGQADDQEAIQKAINAAEARGGGVVFFPPGTFRVNADLNNRRPITIRKGHIVLRGSGATKGGTVILIDEPTLKIKPGGEQAAVKDISNGSEVAAEWMIRIQPNKQKTEMKSVKVTGDTPRETFILTVENAAHLRPGMWITLSVKGQAVVADMIAPYQESDMPAAWKRIHGTDSKMGMEVEEHHLVKSVQGNRITLREPVKTGIRASHGWIVSEYPNIAEIGVEDICFQGGWLGKYVHHRSYTDDNGWAALKMNNVVDSWIRRCAVINFNMCLGVDDCAYTSVMQCVLGGTMGHMAFDNLRRSTGILVGLMDDRLEHQQGLRDTTHGIGVAGSAVSSVFWRYVMQVDESFDMHGNFPYATLFDRIEGGNFSGSGGPIQSFPNHLQHCVAWNFHQRKVPTRFANHKNEYDFWGGRPSLVMPLLIGMHGELGPINTKTVGLYESPGQPVEPESLYEAQLALRFGGKCPGWVAQAKADWAKMNTNLPDFPHSGDNTPWVAKKRLQTIQMILDSPMVKEYFDKHDPKGALIKQWPTRDGQPWVSPSI